MKNKIFSENIERAIRFATKAHEGQYRKSTTENLPYISHCLTVGLLLSNLGVSEETIMAGILHDTIEDTKVTLKDLQKEFGQEIAEMVNIVSDPPGISRQDRIKRHVSIIEVGPDSIRAIKACDTLHNLYSELRALKLKDNIWLNGDDPKKSVMKFETRLKALKDNWDRPILEEIESYLSEFQRLANPLTDI